MPNFTLFNLECTWMLKISSPERNNETLKSDKGFKGGPKHARNDSKTCTLTAQLPRLHRVCCFLLWLFAGPFEAGKPVNRARHVLNRAGSASFTQRTRTKLVTNGNSLSSPQSLRVTLAKNSACWICWLFPVLSCTLLFSETKSHSSFQVLGGSHWDGQVSSQTFEEVLNMF